MARQDQSRITVTLDGVSLGVWETRTGGETGSNNTQYRLGGMGPRISLGGNVMVGNVVARRLYDDAMLAQKAFIRGRVGKGALVVKEQPLDVDGAPTGDPDVWSCTLIRFATPDADAEADTAAQCEIEGGVSGQIG